MMMMMMMFRCFEVESK